MLDARTHAGCLESAAPRRSADDAFPANFLEQVKVCLQPESTPYNCAGAGLQVLYKRLFRLYAHVYYSHFDQLRGIGANAHLNTCFKHFVYFIQEVGIHCKRRRR